MNNRIKELAKQASNEYLATAPASTSALAKSKLAEYAKKLNDDGVAIVPDALFEKFAELIVRECVEQILAGPEKTAAYYAKEAASRVKKHFGIKE